MLFYQKSEAAGLYLEPVRNLHIDTAFLPLDPRQEKNYCLGMDYFLELNKGIVDEYRRRKLSYDVVKKLYHSYSDYQ